MMMLRLFAVACLSVAVVQGFAPLPCRTVIRSSDAITFPSTATQHWSSNRNAGEYQVDNDFKLFLTQCSIQSFMFLLRSMRDPQTVLWLEEFTRPAIVSKSSNPLTIVLADARTEETTEEEPAVDDNDEFEADDGEEFQASEETADTEEAAREQQKFSKLLMYHGLAALNTTIFPTWDVFFEELLKQPTKIFIVESSSAHVPEYELEIDPSSLCSRIISVREQISKEWVRDLQVIANMGGSTLERYWESLRQMNATNTTDFFFQRENLLFLELNADETRDVAPSPLRKGNFDLLVLLATQESIHRVLKDEARQTGPERVTNEFLKRFYEDRRHYFRGPQTYGRSDDFLEELLSSAPRMITISEGVTSLIDPLRIAEMILEERTNVAMEWKELASESPHEHMAIQKLRLNRMMGVPFDVEESFQ